MPYWDERVVEMSKKYGDVKVDKFHIDILTAQFVRNPQWFDVVVASNLFGDILSDLGPPAPARSPLRRPPISIRSGCFLRCSNRSMDRRRTLPGAAWPIRSARSGAAR